MKRYLLVFFAFVILQTLIVDHHSSLLASVPHLMTYQGKLTHSDGVGINDTVQVTFGLYRTAALGETLWTEIHDSVVVKKGLFSVVLGSIKPLNLPFDTSYFLRIVVDGDPLVPRVRQTSSPYAFRAIYADTVDLSNFALWELGDVTYVGLSPGDVLKWNGTFWVPAVDAGAGGADGDWEISGANMYSVPVGNVGIGEETPTAKLHVNAVDKIGLKVGESDSIGIHIDNAEWHGIYVDSAGYAGIYVNQAHDWAGYFNGAGFFRGFVVAGSLYSNLYRDGSYQPLLRSSDSSIDITEDADGSYDITTPHGLGGTGTDNYLARWDGTNSVEASMVYQSDVGNVGIGTPATTARLAVYGSSDGLSIRNSTDDAVEIFNIADDGIGIYEVGGVGIQIDSTGSSGIIIDGASEYGLRINNAKWAGVRIDSSGTHGISVLNSNLTGIRVINSGDEAVQIDSAGTSGIIIDDAAEFGLRVNNAGWAGVRIDSSGTHGISVTNSTNDGIRVTNSGGWAGNFLGDVNITQSLFVGDVPTDTDPDFLLTVIGDQIMKVDATAYEGSGLDADWGVNGNHIYNALPGNVGIGVVTPLAKLHIANASDDGILVQTSGEYGIRLIDSHFHGVFVDSTDASGVYVGRAADNGVWVNVAGEHGVNIAYAGLNGVNITYPNEYGIRVYRSGMEGIYIKEPDSSGILIKNPGENGIIIDSVSTASRDGIKIQNIADDGIEIKNTADEGIYIDLAGDNGLYVNAPGDNGIVVATASNRGMYVFNPGSDGIEISGMATTGRGIFIHDHSGEGDPDTGIVIQDAGDDGIVVRDAGSNGIVIDSPAEAGMLIDSPGSSGLIINGTNYGNGEYGVYAVSVAAGDTAAFLGGGVYISEDLSVDGDIGVGSNLNIDGNLSADGKLTVNDTVVSTGIRIDDFNPTLTMDGEGGGADIVVKYNDNNKWRMHYSTGFKRLSFDYFSGSDWYSKLTLDDSTGYVGIGTTVPDKNLEVVGEGRFRSDADADGSVGSGVLQILNAAGTAGLHLDNNEIQTLGQDLYINQSNMSNTHINAFVHVDTSGKVGIGTSSPQEVFHVNGTAKVDVLKIAGGADLSEQFELEKEPEPGMVVCIDDRNPGKLIVSESAYDRRVAGIISGAGGVNPGMLMGHDGTIADGDYPVALSGRVYCWADASSGPIKPGDLLTTSGIPGHAMKVGNYEKSQGAILGKAMSSLERGQGLILVLVALQ
ncbi:hypothetical protein JXI42_03535 [bacterium]|nr:hypothetical protein [bacterium]